MSRTLELVLLRRRMVAWLAALSTLLMLGVIAASAYIRLSGTGIGCSGWPQCHGEFLRLSLVAAMDSADVARARRLHRLLAPAVLLLALVMLLMALLPPPRLRRPACLGFALTLLAVLLAALGIVAGRSGLPAVVLANLLGGFFMLGLAWRLAAVAGSTSGTAGTAADDRLRRWARWGLLVLVLQIALGGLISATHGASACTGLAQCRDTAAAAGWDWRYLNPWTATALDQVLQTQARGAWLQQLHHLGALLVLLLLAWIAWLAWRQRQRRAALALYTLLLAQLTLGLQLAPAGFPLLQVVTHNLAAALLLALLVRWA